MKELLEEAYLALKCLPNAAYKGKFNINTTYKLAKDIEDHLTIQKQIDQYSSEMFTQLKLKL